jgi:succinoglycan biosynthesis protein ExoA
MTDAVDVSVLVPVLDEEAHIRDTVATMQAQEFPGQLEFLFVDGRSTDRTRQLLEELRATDPRIHLLDNPARRTPQALNIGLRGARGEFVARMDAHTRYPPDYLARGVERLRAGGVAHVSGPQLAEGLGRWSRRVALALSTRLGTGGAGFRHPSADEIEVDSGFTGVWRRATLEHHGGWDEDWPQNQDAELAARIGAAGGRSVCVPAMAAGYVPRDSPRALARQYWRYGKYRAKTSGRHPQTMRRSHLFPPALALCVVLALLPLRAGRLARAALVAYVLALVWGGVSAMRAPAPASATAPADAAVPGTATASATERSGSPADVLPIAFVLAVMHLAWGFGFLAGCLRFGPPLAGVGRALRGGR